MSTQETPFFTSQVENRKLTDDEFLAKREAVLSRWKTGREIEDIDSALAYAKSFPAERNFPTRLRQARSEGYPLFQVGIGHTTMQEQKEHMTRAVEEGVDLILVLTDTYTRKSMYASTEAGIEKAVRNPGTRPLNGFPIVNYGLQARDVFKDIPVPIHISGNVDEEAMLSPEMAFACGCTCDFSHSLHDLVQHSRDYPLEKRIQSDQYISRLAGYYTERGVPIELLTLANYQGLIPPGLGIAVALLSMLIAAEQGVRYISLHRCIEGCLEQDVAAFVAYKQLGNEYATRFSYDLDLVTHAWPWMGAWPPGEYENAALVSWCTSVAVLGEVDWVYLKSVHEGLGIPSTEANLASIQIARELRRILLPQRPMQSAAIAEETDLIMEEARSLLDGWLDLGDGDPCLAQIRGVQNGAIDIPISAWNLMAGEVVAARDSRGAVRYLNPGGLPLPKHIVDYHQGQIADRRAKSGITKDINLVINDIRSYMGDAPTTSESQAGT